MQRELIDQVRRFNRTVTERIGALHDRYLGRERPLGEARLLWEIGAGADLRELRARLGIDSGYLSRLIRSLEAQALVRVEASSADRRVRRVRLTRAGAAERRALDRRSDALAATLLDGLPGPERERLVRAMREVERLLTASAISIAPEPPDTAIAAACLRAYFAELDRRFEGGFSPEAASPVSPDLLLVARRRGEPVGCGAVKLHPTFAEIKRLWVAPSARGVGLGRRLLEELEGWAARRGASVARLDTNRALTEAIALYRACGYREIPRFNQERHADHWFEKDLTDPR